MDMNPLQNHYLISIKRPSYWVMSLLGVLLVIILSLWFSFERGKVAGGNDLVAAVERVAELEHNLTEMQKEMAELRSTNTALQRNNHIEKDANRQVQETIVSLKDEILKLKEELTFYRSIVSPEKSKRRLFMQDLQFTKKSTDEYDYKITVTQRGNNSRVVRGIMRIYFDGTQSGQPHSINMEELITTTENNTFKLGFKYFQRFQGTIKIPEGFTPSTLRVQVVPNSSQLVRIDQTVDWAQVSSTGEQENVGEQKRLVGQS